MSTDLALLDVTAQAELVRRGDLKPLELVDAAIERARAHWGVTIEAAEAIVIGDTPRDVGCGRAGGMRTLAVATGSFVAAELSEAGADHVLEDLSATPDVVTLLTT